jgi:N-acetylglucosaminyldiphosphoundecaprenol N-acetyl-beta-D-mannosaminyltransferase
MLIKLNIIKEVLTMVDEEICNNTKNFENSINNNIQKKEKIKDYESQSNDQIPVCRILGVKIVATDMSYILNFIMNNIKILSGNYICISNVHTTVMSYENDEYRTIQNNAVMAIADGNPLSIIARKKGFLNTKRVTGPDLMEEIFKVSCVKGYRHYFFGSTSETLEKLNKNLCLKYPGIIIAGMYSPPFRSMTKHENESIIKMINESNSDFIWIGLGAPKQEKWMASHKNLIKGLMIGVGAGLNYHADIIKRAPRWMQKHSLEWFFRLLQEPKRLFMRYLITNIKFIFLILKDIRYKT